MLSIFKFNQSFALINKNVYYMNYITDKMMSKQNKKQSD